MLRKPILQQLHSHPNIGKRLPFLTQHHEDVIEAEGEVMEVWEDAITHVCLLVVYRLDCGTMERHLRDMHYGGTTVTRIAPPEITPPRYAPARPVLKPYVGVPGRR